MRPAARVLLTSLLTATIVASAASPASSAASRAMAGEADYYAAQHRRELARLDEHFKQTPAQVRAWLARSGSYRYVGTCQTIRPRPEPCQVTGAASTLVFREVAPRPQYGFPGTLYARFNAQNRLVDFESHYPGASDTVDYTVFDSLIYWAKTGLGPAERRDAYSARWITPGGGVLLINYNFTNFNDIYPWQRLISPEWLKTHPL